MNASMASFQLTGMRQDRCHSGHRDSAFQASKVLAKGSMLSRSPGALLSRLMKAQPMAVSTRHGVSASSLGSMLDRSNRSGW